MLFPFLAAQHAFKLNGKKKAGTKILLKILLFALHPMTHHSEYGHEDGVVIISLKKAH